MGVRRTSTDPSCRPVSCRTSRLRMRETKFLAVIRLSEWETCGVDLSAARMGFFIRSTSHTASVDDAKSAWMRESTPGISEISWPTRSLVVSGSGVTSELPSRRITRWKKGRVRTSSVSR